MSAAAAALRIAVPALLLSPVSSAAYCRSALVLLLIRRGSTAFPLASSSSCCPPMAAPAPPSSVTALSAAPLFSSSSSSPLEKQFEEFQVQLDETGSVRERIRAVVMELEAGVRIMNSRLLLVHYSLPEPEVLEKARAQIEVLKGVFFRLSEILREFPGQYYRYHGDWRGETQTAVSLVVFLHWLDTGNLLMHAEAEKILGLEALEFGLDIEDYLIGLCLMSNELPRYVVNQVTARDYDCPRKVLKFLTDLHAAFRLLNLRNDFLRKKYDGMKYDLRRVEEVYYDVKIRGLGSVDLTLQDWATTA